MGKKYVIELNDIYDSGGFAEPRLLWKAKGFNTLVFDKNGIAKLQPLEDAIEEEINHAVEKELEKLDNSPWNGARLIRLHDLNLNKPECRLALAYELGFVAGLMEMIKMPNSEEEGVKE